MRHSVVRRWARGLGAAALGLAGTAQAGVVWDESVQGDLSGQAASPTALTLSPGSNQVLGASGNLGAGTDLDFFTFTIPAGQQMVSLWVLPSTAPESLGFLGIGAGPQITGFTASALMGWIHYGAFDAGSDILPRIGAGAGATGFTPPLGAGTYSVWIQDFDFGASPYAFDMVLAAVPEPPAALTLLAGLGLLGLRRRRR